jgi:hypothetical protein
LYRGENISDLKGPEVSVALAMMDAAVAEALDTYALPSVAQWMPVKVDYPKSIRLGSESEVLRTLEKYAEIELPYKGRPVVGQSHSVSWAKGAIHVKAYSKYRESKGDPRALGVLRVEPGVIRARSFRHLLGLASDSEVTLGDVLSPEMFQKVHGKFESVLRGDVMTPKEISDHQLFDELVKFFGVRRAITLIGWGLAFWMKGVQSRADMLQVGLADQSTRYRVVADYRRFRDHLLEKGFTLSDEGDVVADVEELASRFARLQAA